MSFREVDEQAPLLPPQKTPLPWGQFSIIMLAQLAEPLTSQVIYPFAPQLVRDIGVTHGDETRVGYYVGILESTFFLAQAMTVLYWSRLSDHVGRKPVIFISLFGLTFSMWCFGLSRSFLGLMSSRILSGALNGNSGVLKSMMVEITDSTNIAQAVAYYPMAWCTGATLGPIIGGYLSRPADRFPEMFGSGLFKQYPYLLACAVPATCSAICCVLAFAYLKETIKNPIPLSRLLGFRKSEKESTPTLVDPVSESEKPLPLRELLTHRVIVAAGNYAFLSITDIAFRAIHPVFLATPVELGGLGLPPSTIGFILSVYGVANALFQLLFFAKFVKLWGPKKAYIIGISSAFVGFAFFPILSRLVKSEGPSMLVWFLVTAQLVIQMGMSLPYGSIVIFISAASPNKASLGATNGISQMSVSIFRTIGPAATNSLYSLSLANGYMGGLMVYYVCMLVSCVAIWMGTLLPSKVWT